MSEPKGAKGVMRARPITSLMYLDDADLDLDAAASRQRCSEGCGYGCDRRQLSSSSTHLNRIR